jgi:hypothetical protein
VVSRDEPRYGRGRLKPAREVARRLVPGGLRPIVGLLALAAALLVGAAPASASEVPVPGVTGFLGLTCSAAKLCLAVGGEGNGSTALVPVTANGVGGITESVTGLLEAIACASPDYCVAVGNSWPDFPNGEPVGEVVPITNGVAGAPEIISSIAGLGGVSCVGPTTCLAVGGDGYEGVMVPVTAGVPGTPEPVPGTAGLTDLTCPVPTSCLAVGVSSDRSGAIVPLTPTGQIGTAVVLPGTYDFESVACGDSAFCVAVGGNQGGGGQGEVVPITNGVVGQVQLVPGASFLLSVACTSAMSCVSGGWLDLVTHQDGVAVPITRGVAGTAVSVPGTAVLTALSTTAGSYLAVGNNSTDTGGLVLFPRDISS